MSYKQVCGTGKKQQAIFLTLAVLFMPLASATSYSVFKACFLYIVQTQDTWLKLNMEPQTFIEEVENVCLL